ncbi:C40 family peptidase [Nocardia yamanashiensis]|uniref:C40 family peptidase n=1 Tax=Nocardia yamanashiensis TaxID=209247 RepID=UPI000A7E40CA|nr:NlpC/P60 family protein [Nocardia yamanashiensis]
MTEAETSMHGPTARAYSETSGMHRAVVDSHTGRDGVVHQAVATSGGTVTDGRSSLNYQIADLRSRIQAITAVGDSRFSGSALLDAAHTAIEKATRQVDSDTTAARKLASQIMPPSTPTALFGRGKPAGGRRSRPARRRRRRPRSNTTTGGAAVRAAGNWLGTPYIYGGGGATGPSGGGFDCSGLTQYAVAQASGGQVVLPRTSQEQIYAGVRVPVEDVRPGDLVFPAGSFGPTGPEHVQLAAGNGMVIEAPYTGASVQWSRMPDKAVVVRVL